MHLTICSIMHDSSVCSTSEFSCLPEAQKLCWNVVRIMASKVCPTLPDSGRSMDVLDRCMAAAEELLNNLRAYGDISGRERLIIMHCYHDLHALRRKMIDPDMYSTARVQSPLSRM
jgi:hypothetical protein